MSQPAKSQRLILFVNGINTNSTKWFESTDSDQLRGLN